MKYSVLAFCLIFIICLFSYTNTYNQNSKSTLSLQQNLPEWVELMYAKNPDFELVRNAYTDFYKRNKFTKNQHTQYYKRWTRLISRELDNRNYPNANLKEIEQQEKNYLKRYNSVQSQAKAGTNWVGLGPFDYDKDAAGSSYACGAAHVYAVEQANSDASIVYAGTATGGMWKSEDQGASWTLKTADKLFNEVYAIGVSINNPEKVFIAADNTLLISINGGDDWSESGDVNFDSQDHSIKDIVMHPSDPNVIFVCSNEGLFRTTNGGSNWTEIRAGDFLELEFKPSNPSIVYAVERSGDRTNFYKSVNGGTTFGLSNLGWPNPSGTEEQRRTEISVSANDPNRVYALATGEANGGSGLYGIYRSNDSGDSWTRMCCGPVEAGVPSVDNPNLMGWSDNGDDDGGQYYYDLAMDVNPNDADEVLVAGVNLWYSYDGGNSFACPAKWSHSGEPNYVHADIHDIKYGENELWIANDGGLFFSDDNGQNFESRLNGIQGTDFWGFGAGFTDGEVLIGGTYHNGTLLKDHDVYNEGWVSIVGGDNIRGFVNFGDDDICYHDNGRTILPGDRTVGFQVSGIAAPPNASYIIGESSKIAFHPQNNNWFYTGTKDSLLFSTDNGGTAELIYEFDAEYRVADIEVAWNDPSTLYVATYGSFWGDDKKVWRSNDTGNSWTEITPNSSDNWLNYDVTISGTNSEEIWAVRAAQTTSGGPHNGELVYYSDDGGSSWTNWTTATLNSEYPSSIVHQRGTNGGVYLGTRRSVYYRNKDMSDWVLYANQLPASTFCTKLVPYYGGGKIRNGSNRGVYEANFFEPSEPLAQIAANRFTTSCLNPTIQFIDHSALNTTTATWFWEFPGGNPSTSDQRNPVVEYDSEGEYDVSLTITDANGTSSQTLSNFIVFDDSLEDIPLSESWEISPDDFAGWEVQSTGLDWQEINTIQDSNCQATNALWVNNFGTNNVGSEAHLFSPKINLGSVIDPSLNYDYAYARYGGGYEDGFRIDVSTNCGQTWTEIYQDFGSSLATVPDQQDPWQPTCSDWENNNLDLSAFSGEEIIIRFAAINAWGNNFYLDNVNVDGTLVPETRFKAVCLLEGPLVDGSSNTMTDLLNQKGFLPVSSPYTSGPWNITNAGSDIILPPNAIDWLFLEARDPGNPSIVKDWTIALVDVNGKVIALDGTEGAKFTLLDPNVSYYISIRHRNHLDLLSANPLALDNSIEYDFSDLNMSQSTDALSSIGAGKYALKVGDYDANGIIESQDFNIYQAQSSNLNGYFSADGSMEGFVSIRDFNKYMNNIGSQTSVELQN